MSEIFDVVELETNMNINELKKELEEINGEISYYNDLPTLSKEDREELRELKKEKKELEEKIKNISMGKKLFFCRICKQTFWAKDLEEAKKLHTHKEIEVIF